MEFYVIWFCGFYSEKSFFSFAEIYYRVTLKSFVLLFVFYDKKNWEEEGIKQIFDEERGETSW